MNTLEFANGVSLEPLMRGAEFLGWGQIAVGGVPLRSARRPMFVAIRNPSGITLQDYTITAQSVSGTRAVLEFSMNAAQTGMMEWMLHTVRNRDTATDWTAQPQPAADTSLRLEIHAVNRVIGGRQFVGFSYQYRYCSAAIPIFKILDRGTWEPGGRAVGNEFWMRNCFVPAIVRIDSVAQFHSTEWYLPTCANPNIFQFLPLQTELQGFTFTANATGTLVTWPTAVAHVRSLFEKPRGVDELVHWHEHCADLGNELTTAPVEVLWAAGGLDRVGRINLYEAVKELVHETLHAELGLRRDRITTYGQIEEWGPADLPRYTANGLPKLLAAGCKTISLANHFQNNMNTWGVGNMCCTVDYQVADSVGPAKLRAFCQQANSAGARVEMWGNTALSTLVLRFDRCQGASARIRFLPRAGSLMEALDQAQMPFVRNPANAIEADHYAPEFCVLNLRDPSVRAYWLKRWQQAHDEIGLAGIFNDSSFNLSSDKFHFVANTAASQAGATADQVHLLGYYRPAQEPPAAILSQYRAHLELMTAMQHLGYHYCNEDLGVFGTHRHGPGVAARLDSLPIWTDCIASFDIPALQKVGADPDTVFFRGLAYRMMWSLFWDITRDTLSFNYGSVRGDYDRPTPWHVQLLKAYNVVTDRMHAREILPGETAVVYRHGETQVLWAFTDFAHLLPAPAAIFDVLANQQTTASQLTAHRHHIYVIGSGQCHQTGPGDRRNQAALPKDEQ